MIPHRYFYNKYMTQETDFYCKFCGCNDEEVCKCSEQQSNEE